MLLVSAADGELDVLTCLDDATRAVVRKAIRPVKVVFTYGVCGL